MRAYRLPTLLVAGLGVRLALALMPVRWLMQKVIPDDSFMYWQVARNILGGHGVSLDGVNLTTAYHPLWMLPTLGVMSLFDNGGDLPVHVSLILSGVLDVVAAWLVYKTAELITKDEKLSLLATTIYLFNPYMLGFVLSGLGDGLNSLCVLAYYYFYFKARAEERDEAKTWIALGVVAGLSMLARTDSVIFHVFLLLHLLLTRKAVSLWDRLRPPLFVGLASCLVVVPWLLYMYSSTGHFVQTSGTSQPFANHALAEGQSALWKLGKSLRKFLDGAFFHMGNSAAWGPLWGGLVLLLFGRGRDIGTGKEERRAKWMPYVVLPFAGLLTLSLVHGGIRWTIRQWYHLPAAWAAAIFFVFALQTWGEAVSKRAHRAALAVLVLGMAGTFVRTWVIGFYTFQSDMYDMAHYIQEHVPKEEKPVIGGFNILTQAYYNPNQVMNLDGIGNEAAMAHVRTRTLGKYVDEVGLKYLVDWEKFPKERYAPFLANNLFERLEPMVECRSEASLKNWGSQYTLYRILPPGTRPSAAASEPMPCGEY